ncbi:hypothetical protein ACJX0J_017166, partial [Zea mays]
MICGPEGLAKRIPLKPNHEGIYSSIIGHLIQYAQQYLLWIFVSGCIVEMEYTAALIVAKYIKKIFTLLLPCPLKYFLLDAGVQALLIIELLNFLVFVS